MYCTMYPDRRRVQRHWRVRVARTGRRRQRGDVERQRVRHVVIARRAVARRGGRGRGPCRRARACATISISSICRRGRRRRFARRALVRARNVQVERRVRQRSTHTYSSAAAASDAESAGARTRSSRRTARRAERVERRGRCAGRIERLAARAPRH